MSFKERKFLSLWFHELCFRNNSKSQLEKNIFLLAFKFKGLLGEELFDYHDLDHDGYIGLDTFLDIVEKYASGQVETVSKEIFNICDSDRDGLVKKTEFLNVVLIMQLGPIFIESFDSGLGKLRKTDSNFPVTCPSESQLEMLSQKENLEFFIDQFVVFPMGQCDMTDFLFREKQIFELIGQKFMAKVWKESVTSLSLIYKPYQFDIVKIMQRGKLVKKTISINGLFLMLYDEKENIELVMMIKDCSVKVKNHELCLSYFSHVDERLRFIFEDNKSCQNYAEKIRVASKYRKFSEFFIIGEKIGSGKFSDVFLVSEKITAVKYAVKIIRKRTMNRNEREMIRKEVEILSNLRHPGIIALKDVFENRKKVRIVTEYVKGHNLLEMMKNETKNEDIIKTVIKKILEVIKFLHLSGVMHRDIKPENIIVFNQNNEIHIKIIDYGLSTYFKTNEVKKLKCGTLGYTAPEILTGSYNEKVDVWSVGIIVYAYITGRLPFFSYSRDEIVELTIFKDLSFDMQEWKHFTSEARDFCFYLLDKDPASRPTTQEALNHEWFQIKKM